MSKDLQEVLRILKKRHKLITKRIAYEDNQLERIRHKSRDVRHGSPHGYRKGFFQDLLVELGNAIEFIEGGKTEEAYLKYQDSDAWGHLCTAVGNISTGQE